jgi:hypothetical protein
MIDIGEVFNKNLLRQNQKTSTKSDNDIRNVKDRFICWDEKLDLLGT